MGSLSVAIAELHPHFSRLLHFVFYRPYAVCMIDFDGDTIYLCSTVSERRIASHSNVSHFTYFIYIFI